MSKTKENLMKAASFAAWYRCGQILAYIWAI